MHENACRIHGVGQTLCAYGLHTLVENFRERQRRRHVGGRSLERCNRRVVQAIVASIEDQDLLVQVPAVWCSSVAHRVHRVFRTILLISTVLRMASVD